MRFPPVSCQRLRNQSPEHDFLHLRGDTSVQPRRNRRWRRQHAWARVGQGPRGAAAGDRVSVTAPSADPRPGRASRRPLIGWLRLVALLLRRCPPLIGGALAAGVRGQVSLLAPGGQRPLPEAVARREDPRRGRADALPSVTSLPPPVPYPEGSRRGGRVGAERADAAHAARVRSAGLAALRARRFRPVGSCSSPR